MPVTSCTIPTRERANVMMQALLRGIEADVIDAEGDVTYVDLIGAQDKIDSITKIDFIEVIETLDSVPHNEPLFTLIGRIGFDE